MFLMDRFGYAKTVDLSVYERNKEAADAENRFAFQCRNTGRICLFTNTGQLYTIKVSTCLMENSGIRVSRWIT